MEFFREESRLAGVKKKRTDYAIKFGKIYADYWAILAKWPTKGRGDVSFPKVRPIKSAGKKWDAERGGWWRGDAEMPGTYIHTRTTTFPFRKEPRFSARPFPRLLLLFGPSSFPSCPRSSSSSRFLRAKSTRPSLSIITAVAITEGLRFPPYIAATFLFWH